MYGDEDEPRDYDEGVSREPLRSPFSGAAAGLWADLPKILAITGVVLLCTVLFSAWVIYMSEKHSKQCVFVVFQLPLTSI